MTTAQAACLPADHATTRAAYVQARTAAGAVEVLDRRALAGMVGFGLEAVR